MKATEPEGFLLPSVLKHYDLGSSPFLHGGYAEELWVCPSEVNVGRLGCFVGCAERWVSMPTSKEVSGE